MKLFKSLLLGTAAGLAAVSSASAADLGAKKPSPVEYVRVCDHPFASNPGSTKGFIIPGTDTCLSISGRVRADYRYQEPGTNLLATIATTDRVLAESVFGLGNIAAIRGLPVYASPAAAGRNANATGVRARAVLRVDAITPSSFGPVRSYFEAFFQGHSGNFGGDSFAIDKAFIQFANITAGRFASFYDAYAAMGGPLFGDLRGADNGTVNGLAYTLPLGGGLTATIAAESLTERRTNIIGTNYANIGQAGTPPAAVLGAPTTFTNGYGGSRLPAIVAAVNLQQSWGRVHVGAMAQQLFVNQQLNNFGADTKWGYGINGGVRVNLPMLSNGSYVWVSAAYSEGMIRGVTDQGNGLYGNGVVALADAVAVSNGVVLNGVGQSTLKLTKAMSVNGGVNFAWTPTIQQGVFGSYLRVDHANTTIATGGANNLPATVAGFPGQFRGFTGGLDLTEYRIGTNVRWTPARGLLIGAEVIYINTRHDRVAIQNFKGATGVTATTRGGDAWEGRLRIQRDF